MSRENEYVLTVSSVSTLNDPFDSEVSISHTSGNGAAKEKPVPDIQVSSEDVIDREVESVVVRGIFGGNEVSRRYFRRVLGSADAP